MAEIIVEHFRLDPSRKLGRALGLGAVLMVLGAVAVAVAILIGRGDPSRGAVPRRPMDPIFRRPVTADGTPIDASPTSSEIVFLAAGIVCILGGGASAILGLRGVMTEEAYLVLRTDGALFRADSERSFVPWAEIEQVRWDETARAVLFVRHDGSAWARSERYAGIDGATLAKCAAEVRRKALFNLIK